MKRLTSITRCVLSLAVPLSLALAVMTSNATCFWFSYQPNIPEGLRRYSHKM